MAVVYLPNELLNFAVCASKQLNASTLTSIIGGFYHDDELANSKAELCKFQQTLSPNVVIDGWDKLVNKHGGPIKRQGGDSRQRRMAEAEDIVQMLSLLTLNKIILPCFVTVNLEKVPPMTRRCCPAVFEQPVGDDASSRDVMSADMSTLCTTMNAILQRLDAVEMKLIGPVPPVQPTATDPVAVSTGNSHTPATDNHSSSTVTPNDKLPTPTASVSWASRVASAAKVYGTKAAVKPATHIVRGNRSSGTVRAIQRPLTCFVGRLDVNTTESDLSNYLDSAGIHNAVCKKLSAKDGRVFNTAAFRVTCCADYYEAFYNESNWPIGAEIRDWVFYSKDGSS